MRGARLPLSNMPSWRGVQLKHRAGIVFWCRIKNEISRLFRTRQVVICTVQLVL
jgi:hypothetical protein